MLQLTSLNRAGRRVNRSTTQPAPNGMNMSGKPKNLHVVRNVPSKSISCSTANHLQRKKTPNPNPQLTSMFLHLAYVIWHKDIHFSASCSFEITPLTLSPCCGHLLLQDISVKLSRRLQKKSVSQEGQAQVLYGYVSLKL